MNSAASVSPNQKAPRKFDNSCGALDALTVRDDQSAVCAVTASGAACAGAIRFTMFTPLTSS